MRDWSEAAAAVAGGQPLLCSPARLISILKRVAIRVLRPRALLLQAGASPSAQEALGVAEHGADRLLGVGRRSRFGWAAAGARWAVATPSLTRRGARVCLAAPGDH